MAEPEAPAASLVVVDPGGSRTRVRIHPLPFLIGRQQGNHLILRDVRISREHARIVAEGGAYVIEDLNSRNGVYVNDGRVVRRKLTPPDRISFGVPNSYQLVFSPDESGIHQLAGRLASPHLPGDNLARLRAVVELKRIVETSFSTAEVLNGLIDAALAITGAERGFLLLRQGEGLEVRVARDRRGVALKAGDLRVPTAVIHQALARRRELLSMNFDPLAAELPTGTVAELELRSMVCIPLVRIRIGMETKADLGPSEQETIGVVYLDSRAAAADLSSGNRELLQTLALEASTVLENARLIEGEHERQRIEEELDIARGIQESLLPQQMPSTGWLRAAGRSVPSRQVGGDYFDLRQLDSSTWALVNADVSGKGVSSALLAALLQGVFLATPYTTLRMEEGMARLNAFLLERTGGEKYATVFFATLDSGGLLRFVNAGHGAPLLARASGIERLRLTGLPVGMLEEAAYSADELRLAPGDKVVVYTDGLTEAQNSEGLLFGEAGVRKVVRAHSKDSCQVLCDELEAAVAAFTDGVAQADDRTIMVVEYCPDSV